MAARQLPAGAATPRVFCFYVDRCGRQHFNFPQLIWLEPGLPMAVTGIMTVALQTLAVNLLTQVVCRGDPPACEEAASRRLLRLARRFCQECLLTSGQSGWKIPRQTVRSWLAARAQEPAED